MFGHHNVFSENILAIIEPNVWMKSIINEIEKYTNALIIFSFYRRILIQEFDTHPY